MIYNDKLWQSINETNKESKYLQFCRSKADCQFRIHCLLEAVCYLTFKLFKTPSGCCMSFASQVRATTEQPNTQNTGYLSKTFLVCFIMAERWPKYFWPENGQTAYGRKVAKIFLAWKWPNTDLQSERWCNNMVTSNVLCYCYSVSYGLV